MPFGDTDWYNMNSYWRSNIVSTLKTNCHQSRRFNPVAWVDCHNNLDKDKLDYFISEFFRLSNNVYYNNTFFRNFAANMTMFSDGYWDRINSGSYENKITLALLFLWCVSFLFN